jgi:hypothetical protein
MHILMKNIKTLIALSTLVAASSGAFAQSSNQFSNGIPTSWECTGTCGTSADVTGNSVVSASGGAYGWISTVNGIDSISPFTPPASSSGGGFGGNTNGTVLQSNVFSASAGETLKYNFNYVTSDGATYSDYAWTRVLNASDKSQAALIFTARTNIDLNANVVPGFGLANPDTTLSRNALIISSYNNTDFSPGVAGPEWSPLGVGGSSNTCYSTGCGYTGWVGTSFTFNSSGKYILEFGVTNWDDTAFDSALAFNSVKIRNKEGVEFEIDDDLRKFGSLAAAVPEPETYAMLLAGLGMMGAIARRRTQGKQS